jgi:hypothetical protein
MPSKASSKKKGGNKDAATKNTFNPPLPSDSKRASQTREPEEQAVERQVGQFGEAGQPPLMKK